MKLKLIFSLFFILFFRENLFPQNDWFVQPGNTNSRLNTVYFLDDETGFAAGGRTFLKTTNGGTKWTPLKLTYEFAQISDLYFIDYNTGFIVGTEHILNSHGMIASTIDGGNSWKYDIYGSTQIFRGIAFINRDNGIIVGSNGTGGVIFRTGNSGESWTEIFSPSPYELDNVSALPDGTCMSAGYFGVIVRSIDAGVSWNRLQNINSSSILSLFLLNTNIAYVTTTGSGIYKSTNGGLSWDEQKSNTNYNLYSCYFINNSTGWITSDSNILRTTNSGVNWILFGNFGHSLFDIYFSGSLTGYIVGDAGIILKTTNSGGLVSAGFENSIATDNFSLHQNYPNPFNPVTVISYSLSENRFVTLKVFDVRGNEIATLVNEKQNIGNYNCQFSTVNYQLSSGIYFYKLEAGQFVETKRMILLK